MKVYVVTKKDYDLIDIALDALDKSFDGDYHTTGAALRCKGGSIFTGADCNSVHGWCAEFAAAGAAVAEGEKDFDTVVAVHNDAQNNLISPCGNCRQMLTEYSPDIKVIVNDAYGNPIKVKIKDLLPLQ